MNTAAPIRCSLAAVISSAASTMALTPPPAAHPFAEMLRQAHGEGASPAPAPAPAPAPQRAQARPANASDTAKAGSGADRPEAAEKANDADHVDDDIAGDATDAASTTAALKARARLAVPPGKNVPSDRHADTAESAPVDAPGAAAEAASRAAEAAERRGTSLPDGAANLATALRVGVVAPASTDVATSNAGTDASALDGNADAPAGNARSPRHRISAADAGATASSFGTNVAVRDEKAAAAQEALANAAQRVEGASPRLAASADSSAAIAALAQSVATPSPAAAASPIGPKVVQAYVPAPVESPAFAAAFGVQVSVLAQDGVQRAELHLNPAEMGPVAIRIRIEGREARIDFGAEVAATRQAIEASLPQLAGALNDAGFTLAGGGVSQHTGQQPRGGEGNENGADDDARSGRHGDRRLAMPASAEAIAKMAGRMSARMAAGGVDLYA